MASRIEHISSGDKTPVVPPVDSKISPLDDFYSYVNARWQKTVKMPAYEDDYGVSEEIESHLRHVLIDAIEKHRHAHPSNKLAALATSFLEDSYQASAVLDLQQLLDKFKCIDSPESLAKALGTMNRIQSAAPISFVINSDYYDSKKCCVYLYEASLGLPSKGHYDPEAKDKILESYIRFLSVCGRRFGIENLERAVTIETRLLPFLSDVGELRDVEYVYNPHSLSELTEKYPNVPWHAMFKAWGLKDPDGRTKYIVTNTEYFAEFDRLFTALRPEDWAVLLQAATLVHFVKYLPPPFDDLHFELFEKKIKGNTVKVPQKLLTLKVLMNYAQQDLSRMYVGLVVQDDLKRRATELIGLLKAATTRRIRGLKWMEPITKRAALRKVSAMAFQVAYPAHWRSETAHVLIDPKKPLTNILTLSAADTDTMITDLVKRSCRKRPEIWKEGSFEVNAYYYPEGNMMVVPAGILSPPFFDLKRSMAWNLGGIGAAISHEITHGFDDDGRLFDEKGNYSEWWSASDSRTYKQMSKAVVDLFEGQKYMGGEVNGEMTLSENLADLGGLAIALEALRAILPKDPEGAKKMYREFFTSYAVSWRQKDRPKKAKQALVLDVHAPPIYRVNLIVRQFEEFFYAFDGVAPTERIEFW
jgi:putative endopeptidase